MKWQSVILLVMILVCGLLLGVMLRPILLPATPAYVPTLSVIGDVATTLEIRELEGLSVEQFDYKNKKFRGVALAELISRAVPRGNSFDLLLLGSDGLTASLSGAGLEGCYITFTGANGWEAINLYHPVSSNIKHLQEIIVVSRESLWSYGLNWITPEKNLRNITPGQLLQNSYISYNKFEGTSEVKQPDATYLASIYTRRRIVRLEDFLPDDKPATLLVVGAEGEMVYHRKGFLEVKGNQINYLSPEEKITVSDVRGVVVNPTPYSITDTFYDAGHYLEAGQRVLVIILDGFGYTQYQQVQLKGVAPFLLTLPDAKKALSVFQPVTNAGLAALLTGVGPADNGVYSRRQKDLRVPDLFAFAAQLGKAGVLVEGDMKILNTSVEPLLHLDTNNNGSKDDEIFASALSRLTQEEPLLVVHFHSIDDSGHSYGPEALETYETIQQVDGYVAELVQAWDGQVILVADHGMHTTLSGGEHGVPLYEDMYVPYLICKGGRAK